MHEIDSPHPPGTIGYCSSGIPRYYSFFDSLETTIVPQGTRLRRAFSCNVAKNCNMLVQEMVGEWIWIQGDDHTWDPDLLMRLLDHDVDIVVPLVPRWGPPFLPVIYKVFEPGGEIKMFSWQELQVLRSWGKALVPVEAGGSAGMLVRRHVIEKMRAQYGDPIFRVGLTGKDELSEDLEFTWRAQQMGFQVMCDVTAYMGHLTQCAIEPYDMKDGRLAITANIHGGRLLAYTTSQPEQVTV